MMEEGLDEARRVSPRIKGVKAADYKGYRQSGGGGAVTRQGKEAEGEGTVNFGGEEISTSMFKRLVDGIRKGGGSITVKGLKKGSYMQLVRAKLATKKDNPDKSRTFTLTAKGKKAIRMAESIMEGRGDKRWQQGQSAFSPIGPSQRGGVSGSAGGPGDAASGSSSTPGVQSNSQAAAQAAAVGEAGKVFAGIYGATPGQVLNIRGKTYKVTGTVNRGTGRDWLTMGNTKGDQFMLMLPAKGPGGELNAPHLTIMQKGRARTDPFDITVQDLMGENEEFFGQVLDEPFGFDRLDGVTEGKIPDWLMKDVDFDLRMGSDYVPAKAVLGNRARTRQRDEIEAVGKAMFGKNFYTDVVARKDGLFASTRDNRDKVKFKANNQKLAAAIAKKGYKIKWDPDGFRFTALYDKKKVAAAEGSHGTYVALLTKKRGGQTEGLDQLYEAAPKGEMSPEQMKKHELKRVASGSGPLKPGTLVQNSSKVYGIFLGYDEKSDNVGVVWSHLGEFNLGKLKTRLGR
jgi:hypothetical protein